MRFLTAGEKAVDAAPKKRMAYLVHAKTPAGDLRFCTARYTLTINGEEWIGVGRLLEIQFGKEDANLTANKAVLRLSGLNAALIALSVNEQIEGSACWIYRALYDPETHLLVGAHVFTRRIVGQVRITPPTESQQ